MRLRNLIPCKAMLALYKSSILLTYCHLVWNVWKSSDSRKLERIQERALRAVFRSRSETYEQLLKRADLPSLQNRRRQVDIAILMFKVKNNLAPKKVLELFHTPYTLRNSDFDAHRYLTIIRRR